MKKVIDTITKLRYTVVRKRGIKPMTKKEIQEQINETIENTKDSLLHAVQYAKEKNISFDTYKYIINSDKYEAFGALELAYYRLNAITSKAYFEYRDEIEKAFNEAFNAYFTE